MKAIPVWLRRGCGYHAYIPEWPSKWDPDKNAANIAKHGIGFEDALRIFEGPVLESIDERRDYGDVPSHSALLAAVS